MATTLTEVLATLQKVGQAPEVTATPAPAAAPAEIQVSEDTELRKLAEEYDAAGRIMAAAFADELQKIAVGVTGVTPNTAAVPENPAVQVSDQDIQLANVGAVVGQLRALTQGAEADLSPAGKVEVSGGHIVMPTPASVAENPPVAADMAPEKKASAAVDVLYSYFFGN